LTWAIQTSLVPAENARRLRVNLVSSDPGRRSELRRRLEGDTRLTLSSGEAGPGEDTVLALDVAGSERDASQLIRDLALRDDGPKILAVVNDEDDIDFATALLLAGAAGVTSLHQPSSGICQAVVDVADGLASVSPSLEVELLRRLQALPAD
jgi:DNA-binding NarL/FixJ family response regulator